MGLDVDSYSYIFNSTKIHLPCTHACIIAMNPPNSRPFVLGSGLHNVPPDVGGICLVFGHEDVANPRVGRCVDDLMYLSNSAEHCHRFANSVVFVFDGYNGDPREVHEIPECRAFLATLNAHWPYWMHFLAPIPDLWATFLLCLTPPAPPVAIGAGKFARRYDPAAFKGLLLAQLHAMNNLHQLHALDVPMRQRIFQSAMAAVDATTMDHPEGPQS